MLVASKPCARNARQRPATMAQALAVGEAGGVRHAIILHRIVYFRKQETTLCSVHLKVHRQVRHEPSDAPRPDLWTVHHDRSATMATARSRSTAAPPRRAIARSPHFRTVSSATSPDAQPASATTSRSSGNPCSTSRRTPCRPGAIPVRLTRAQLLAAPDNTLFRLGHSTMLIKLGGASTSPTRCFPSAPRRCSGPAGALPRAAEAASGTAANQGGDTVARPLRPPRSRGRPGAGRQDRDFLAPLGVGDRLVEWGVGAAKVRQLDWWQSTQMAGVKFVATPAQHFPGVPWPTATHAVGLLGDPARGFESCSSAATAATSPASGRSARRSGPSSGDGGNRRLTPCGPTCNAAGRNRPGVLDLKGKVLMPVHNGTFDLALHGWRDPFDRIPRWRRKKVSLSTPQMGEPLECARSCGGAGVVDDVDN